MSKQSRAYGFSLSMGGGEGDATSYVRLVLFTAFLHAEREAG